MPVERYFLDWDAPVTAKVREFLLPQHLSGPVDLGKDLIVVPTRQAGRRLREALALHCAEQKTALLSPQVVTPPFLLHSSDEPANVANPTEVAAVWADVLMKADLTEYGGLFPARATEQNFAWAMHTGEMIQRLRDTLVEGGYLIADVVDKFGDVLEETERWRDLAKLEEAYLKQLEKLGRCDPSDIMIKQSQNPKLPEGVERIVIAAVPDPTPLVIQALEHLEEQIPIAILIHAPRSLADYFDEWGRPLAESWRDLRIDIPHAEENVILAGTPVSQSKKTLEAIAGEADRFGPNDIAIGVPDGRVTPFLAADLEDKGLLAFDPAGKALSQHPLYHLLDAFRSLVNEGNYAAFSSFLRHADVLNFLQRKYHLPPRWLLKELDDFQNSYLPQALEDITGCLSRQGEQERWKFRSMERAVAFIREQVNNFRKGDLDDVVRSLLQTIYQGRMLNPNNPEDAEFIEVAELIDAALREFSGGVLEAMGVEKRYALELLLRRLEVQRYSTEREGAVIDLEGWLELPWNGASLLIVTGMNDGVVPDSQLSDVFLPDSLRSQLNLRHDADRFARDMYLMRGLIESRRQDGGRVCFIAGKTSSEGEPLKPSRLLFCCDDEELPRRVERLFGDPDERRDNHPATISFPLEAKPPADIKAARLDLSRLPVTWFKDYLACPFRFYLKHVLGMEELDDEKRELDAMDFGKMVHYALQKMAGDEGMRQCEKEHELSDFLCARAEDWMKERFGSSPPLQLGIQLDAARQRLNAAAREQVRLVRQGWEIMCSEMVAERELSGMLIRGRIDRIDRHRDSGLIRVLDYKTSDNAESPEKAHIGSLSRNIWEYARVNVNGAGKCWIDLQLPLYRLLLCDKEEFQGRMELGYFNLPKAVSETGVAIWEGLSDALLESAGVCAEGVIENIQRRRFWPPSAKVRYDDFEGLFHADIADCINIEIFEAFMEGG
jgi:ATP-dependent helicase/nuclease subunit B